MNNNIDNIKPWGACINNLKIVDLNPLSNINSPKLLGTLNLEDTPSTMIKSKLKKKIAKQPENVSI